MSELMVLLQALLLIAGWLLFLRAQAELRAQAARQSLTGELEELRQTVDALLQKLAEEAAQAEARLRELKRSTGVPPVHAPSVGQGRDAPTTVSVLQGRDAPATVSVGQGRDAPATVSVLQGRDAPATVSALQGRDAPATVSVGQGRDAPATVSVLQGRDAPATVSALQGRDAPATTPETFTPDSGYNLTVPETSLYGAVAMLAEQGLSVPEIARQTGYAPGEVELILSLKRRSTEENR